MVKKIGPACFVLSFLISGSTAALASEPNYVVNVYENTRYYDIEGSTAGALLDEMEAKGPKRQFSKESAYAQTESGISWYLHARQNENLCMLESVDLTVELTYLMPRWAGSPRAGRKLRKAWEAFEESLWVHERGHGEIARRGAVAIGEQLIVAPPAPTCDELRDSLGAISKQILRTSVEPAQKKYDALTRDGQTQRARL